MAGTVESSAFILNPGCPEGNELVSIDMLKSHKPLKYELPIGSRGYCIQQHSEK